MTSVAMVTGSQRLEQLYRDDGDRLWRALLAFGRDPDLASDAVAEAYAQALRRGDAVRDPQAWVWRTAFRVAAGELQRRRRVADLPREDRGYEPPPGIDDDLLDALEGLPPAQRAAVILFYFADLPVREIASRTGRNALLVRADLSRGRKRLRRILGATDA